MFVNKDKNFNNYVNKIIKNNKLSHAYIIEINDYENDIKYILDFVKCILCKNNVNIDDLENCKKCNLCHLIDTGNYPDLFIVEPEGKEIKKDQLIKLKKDFSNKSLLNNKKIYIIKEADKLNDASANTILKFLEEPESNIIAILVTINRYRIIETILSRCQILKINNSSENIKTDDILDLLNYLINGSSLFVNYNDIINNIIPDKNICLTKMKIIQNILVDYIVKKDNNVYYNVLKNIDDNIIINLSLIIEDYLKKLEFNVNYKLWLDSLFSSIIGCERNV